MPRRTLYFSLLILRVLVLFRLLHGGLVYLSKFSKFKRKAAARAQASKKAEAEYWKKVEESDKAEFEEIEHYMQASKEEQDAILKHNISRNIAALDELGLLDDCTCCCCKGVPCPYANDQEDKQ